MKRIFLALFLLWGAMTAAAQQLALGEKTPDLKIRSWLDGRMPAHGRPALLVFFHSASRPSVESLASVRALSAKFDGRLDVVVIAKEAPETVAPVVRPYAGGNMTVAFDDDGRTFSAYDVHYLPFGVLVTAKGRALWMGNPRQLTEKMIESNLED